MAANAIDGAGGDVRGRFPGGCCAVVATAAIRRCGESAVVYLRASPGSRFMARAAVGCSCEMVTWFSRCRAAVVATRAVRRRREQTVVYLRASPAGSLVTTITGSLGDDVPRRFPGRRTSVMA